MEGRTCDPETEEYGHKPRFRSERRYGSLTYNILQGFGFEGNRLVLVKIGKIRYRNSHRQKSSEMRTCTIMKKAGKWYAIIAYCVPKVHRSEEDLDNLSHPEAYDPELVDLINRHVGGESQGT